MSISKNSNHDKAPIAAALVKQFREVFGDDCKALYVKEGDLEIGSLPPDEDRCESELVK